MEKNEIRCPKCRSMARIAGMSVSSCVHYTEVYDEDGKLIIVGHNKIITKQTCLKCGHEYRTENGKVVE